MPPPSARIRSRASLLALALAWSLGSEPAGAGEAVFTDFEGLDTGPGEPFSIGVAPARAIFGGDAFAGVIGAPLLYFSGFSAFMIEPLGRGTIEFESPAASVSFHARAHPLGSGALRLRALGPGGAESDERMVTPAEGWVLVAFSGSVTRIEADDLDAGRLHAIDDFGFTPVPAPEPGRWALAVAALASLAGLRMRG